MPNPSHAIRDKAKLLEAERGRMTGSGGHTILLAGAAPYRASMSSLGYQTIYRVIQSSSAIRCERAFAPEKEPRWNERVRADSSLESGRLLGEFAVIAFSIAYELELPGLLGMLHRALLPVHREERDAAHPLIVAGGPLTFSNPALLGPFADVVIVGEAEDIVVDVMKMAFEDLDRVSLLEHLAGMDNVWVPSIHGCDVPAVRQVDNSWLPAWAPIQTPNTELRNMFLVEAVRGCSRGCDYCVMRRKKGAGMRIVPAERILAAIPEDASRVGLVGASVSDHPKIVPVVNELADRHVQVGLSSLRAERLTLDFVTALKRGGYKTVTTAMDGASERVRAAIHRTTTKNALIEAVNNCRSVGMQRVKLYLMVGVPGEQDEDIDEAASDIIEMSKLLPITLSVSPFCAKKRTPLDGQPFAGIRVVDRRLKRLRRQLKGRAELRATSSRWAWIEHVLSQGGCEHGEAVLEALIQGGSFSAYRKAFEALGERTDGSRDR